ncbi:MAG: hypothetical protein GXP61_02300 [Epsilonproteobacteria bacterium]|nr:hypothetical protein [Campylobacterota bacterium]
MAKMKYSNEIIKNVIKKNQTRREVSQLSIKIDKKLDISLHDLSSKLNISKNKLIEDILYESGIIEEVQERLL